MRKIRRGQGRVHDAEYDRFHHSRPLDKAPWTFQDPGVRADAQCCKITWLEELASESNTIQAQEVLLSQGRQQAKTQENYMLKCDGFSLISLDCSIRLGSRLLWYKKTSVCFHGLQRDHPENPYEKD